MQKDPYANFKFAPFSSSTQEDADKARAAIVRPIAALPLQSLGEITCHRGRRVVKRVRLTLGGVYFVDPMNPAKKQYRGRPCQVIGRSPEFGGAITIQFLDQQGRKASIDAGDLTLLESAQAS